PWEKWADATDKSYPRPGTPAAIKAGRSGNERLLDRYGDMLQGLSYQAEAGSVRVGFDQSYATFHEFGVEFGKRRMPRRGLLMANPQAGTLAPDDERAVLDVLSDFLFQE
ncbi:MAG: phage virion morphogenesis protein, partial [Ottowia sp.]